MHTGTALRFLHVINSLSGSGGAEQGLVRELVHLGSHTHRVVTLYGRGTLADRLEGAGIETLDLGLSGSNSGWNWMWAARLLRRQIETFQPDVVHTSLASANLAGQLAARSGRVPVLSTLTLSGDPRLVKKYQPGADSLAASAFRRVAGIVGRNEGVWYRALTADAAETNRRAMELDANRIVVIPRGVPPLERSRTANVAAEIGLPDDIPIVLNVGRQTAQKGHEDLVDVLSRVLKVVEVHLVILGRVGDSTSDLMLALDRHGVRERVSIVPYTEHVADFYRLAHVFLFPSHMEGLGTAVLEAMASGLPVVAYDIPPVNEVTGGGRFASLVPAGDTQAMTESVLARLQEGRDTPTTRRAQEHVRSDYAIEKIAGRVEQLLVEVATSP